MSSAAASLNSDQRRAVECHHGPLLIVAGPGSGKTRVMTHRIAHMVHCGIPADSILAITFTNKAAEEMLGRTLALLGDLEGLDSPPQISTFHSFCARLLRREIYHLEPYRPDFTIYDAEDQKGVLEEAVARLNLDKTAFPATQVRSTISRWKNDMITPAEIADRAVTHRSNEQARLYALYQQLLIERNALDFDDLLLLALRVVREVDFVRERRRAQHQYIMIDEFQDTNRPQYLLARLLAEQHRNLCITGDPDQSIYSWRGASPENFARFAEDFPQHATVLLNRNYRSTPQILGAASRLTATAGSRALYTENPPGDPVRVQQVASEREEAQQIVRLIEAWTLAGTSYRDIAVLYRVNSLSRSIEEEFVRSGVPYTVVGGVAFYQRKEVKDIIAYLRAAAFPRDEVALRRIINTPNRGLGTSTIDRLADLAGQAGQPLGTLLRDAELCAALPARARSCLDSFRALLAQLEGLIQQGRPLSELVKSAIELTQYSEHLKKSEPDSWDERQRNLDELANAAQETEDLLLAGRMQPDAPTPLQFFLERIALVADIDQWEERDDRVAAMTLHAAKGLEFDRVALAGLEQGLLPLIRLDRDSEADVDEERRLLYVGVTRARKSLALLHAATRRRFREREHRIPSVFLSELRGEGVVTEQLGASYDWQPWRSRGTNERAHVDFDADDADPSSADFQDDSELRKGIWIEHDNYGRGVVTKASGFGDMKKITVRFEQYGEKVLVARYTPFRVLSGPDEADAFS
ncbi:MAG: ATP-dependent helicase [Planctomycetota bacterium]